MKRVFFLYKNRSGCRWTTGAQARSIFHSLSSDTKKLEAVKDQILMRTLGCGWKHLYPQWQVDNRKRTADELLEHLITVVMEYEKSAKAIVPPSVGVKLVSRQKGLTQMGSATADVQELKSKRKEKRKKIRAQVKTDLNVNEDKWKSKCQPYKAPKRDKDLINNKIEVCFEMDGADGSTFFKWFVGKVLVVYEGKEDKDQVLVTWDDENEDNSVEILTQGNFNKEKKAGAWRLHSELPMNEATDDNNEDDGETSDEAVSGVDSVTDIGDEDSLFDEFEFENNGDN